MAWDSGTGSGQAAHGLARHFARVVATDASVAQIAHATPHPRIEYRVVAAERSGLADRSVALAAAAQALHWFDIPAFFAEVRRVLAPDGVIAVWCYHLLEELKPHWGDPGTPRLVRWPLAVRTGVAQRKGAAP